MNPHQNLHSLRYIYILGHIINEKSKYSRTSVARILTASCTAAISNSTLLVIVGQGPTALVVGAEVVGWCDGPG